MTLSRLLDTMAYITGTVDQELLLWNEYLVAENRILKAQLKGRPRFSDAERARLGEIGRRLGRKALIQVATAALPDTISSPAAGRLAEHQNNRANADRQRDERRNLSGLP
jgi:hypothetical protein